MEPRKRRSVHTMGVCPLQTLGGAKVGGGNHPSLRENGVLVVDPNSSSQTVPGVEAAEPTTKVTPTTVE